MLWIWIWRGCIKDFWFNLDTVLHQLQYMRKKNFCPSCFSNWKRERWCAALTSSKIAIWLKFAAWNQSEHWGGCSLACNIDTRREWGRRREASLSERREAEWECARSSLSPWDRWEDCREWPSLKEVAISGSEKVSWIEKDQIYWWYQCIQKFSCWKSKEMRVKGRFDL